MMLLGYNRKLAWVTVAAVCWALIGLSASLGQTRLGPPPMSIQVGAPPGEISLPGRLISVTETEDMLEIIVAVQSTNLPKLPTDLPHDLKIILNEGVTDQDEPPVINLNQRPPRIQRGLDSKRIETEHYSIRFGRSEVRIRPKDRRPSGHRLDNLRRQRGAWVEPLPE